ncbi:MAG TPA: succinylglutamate desuccinylase/aspartoacylase family protein [Thermoanaerobaculia bacterium]|nr:succinylglutamate desuccinylase/aspartoacylase family protein [Thermoanaerobaculia bacterium]
MRKAEARPAAAAREPLSFCGNPVGLGETAELRLRVGESYTAEPVSLPVTVVRGGPGPTLFVTATVHGDELNGVGILRDLLNDTDFSGLRGTLIAVPVVNVPGFLVQDRRLPDRRDLNRSFPGSPKGSLTARLADTLFREIVRQSDFGLDLHTGGGERTNYPQIRADLSDPRTAELADAFGIPLVVGGVGPEGSLRRVATAAGVPTVVYEAGSARRLERPFIQAGIAGILNVLRFLRMMPGETVEPPVRLRIERTHWIRAQSGGILDLQVALGQPVRRGTPISLNTNPFGRGRSQLKSPYGGLVLGLTQLPLVHSGDPVCHIARLEAEELAAWESHWLGGPPNSPKPGLIQV